MKIEITNPEKIIFPKQKIKKIDVINYYFNVADLMLPFVKNRLLAVIRCHGGIAGECFFKKHPTNDADVCQRFFDDDEEYFFVKTQKDIISQVQMGTLEFHTWASDVKNLEKPNMMVFDLDPDEKLPLAKLCDAALKVKSVLDDLSLESFLKTSGGKGYHIVVPFKSCGGWENFYGFAKQIALLAEGKWPNIFTTNIKKSARGGKIFLDYLRNNRGSTCVAPYSLRARDGASISMPIAWQDLPRIKPNEITIKNYQKYQTNSWQDFCNIKQKIK